MGGLSRGCMSGSQNVDPLGTDSLNGDDCHDLNSSRQQAISGPSASNLRTRTFASQPIGQMPSRKQSVENFMI